MEMNGQNKAIWIGVAIGAAVGLGYALSRNKKKRDPWSSAKLAAERVASRTGDISDATKDIVERIRTIYEEGKKVVEDAGELWSHGRKLVGV
jgi:gas vesicle protein